MDRIYLDSCLVIYLVERHPHFFAPLRNRIAAYPGATFCISALTRLEVLARPLRDRDYELAQRYEAFLKVHELLAINDAVVDGALDWRVSGLKTPDALHAALAKHHGCTDFWTNHDRLAKAAPGWSANVLQAVSL